MSYCPICEGNGELVELWEEKGESGGGGGPVGEQGYVCEPSVRITILRCPMCDWESDAEADE